MGRGVHEEAGEPMTAEERAKARHPFARVKGFIAEMREKGIHVGVGTPPKCATCDEAWPCSTERGV